MANRMRSFGALGYALLNAKRGTVLGWWVSARSIQAQLKRLYSSLLERTAAEEGHGTIACTHRFEPSACIPGRGWTGCIHRLRRMTQPVSARSEGHRGMLQRRLLLRPLYLAARRGGEAGACLTTRWRVAQHTTSRGDFVRPCRCHSLSSDKENTSARWAMLKDFTIRDAKKIRYRQERMDFDR